jgi:hypothetical protein
MRWMVSLFVLSLALSSSAQAKPGSGSAPRWGENPGHNYESSQWFLLELKFSPYTPHIDDSAGLNGNTPFSDLFNPPGKTGLPSRQLLTQLEFDVQFLHRVGSLGVGATLGYYRRTAHAFQFSGSGASCPVETCARSGDETALNVIPMSLLLVYRFDYLAQRYHIPLVPYMKAGLAYYIWIIQNGSGSVAQFQVDANHVAKGYGGSFGFVLNPGIAFLLDVLDPKTARTIDAEIGINHTYLFCELHYANVDGFGASNKLNLGDTTFNAGIAFEF